MDLYQTKVLPRFDAIREFLLSGGRESELPRKLEISSSSLRRYRRDYPDFARLLTECREILNELADDQVEAALFKRATGYDVSDGDKCRHVPADVKAAVFWLKNRRPKIWRDRKEVTLAEPVHIHLSADEKEV